MKTVNWTHEDILAMQAYSWPGNIRELRNMMERCILLGKPPADYWRELQGDALPVSVTNTQGVTGEELEINATHPQRPCQCHEDGEDQYCYPVTWTLKEVEKAHIMQVVDASDGNKSAAARQLGVARKTLERKYKEWTDEL